MLCYKCFALKNNLFPDDCLPDPFGTLSAAGRDYQLYEMSARFSHDLKIQGYIKDQDFKMPVTKQVYDDEVCDRCKVLLRVANRALILKRLDVSRVAGLSARSFSEAFKLILAEAQHNFQNWRYSGEPYNTPELFEFLPRIQKNAIRTKPPESFLPLKLGFYLFCDRHTRSNLHSKRRVADFSVSILDLVSFSLIITGIPKRLVDHLWPEINVGELAVVCGAHVKWLVNSCRERLSSFPEKSKYLKLAFHAHGSEKKGGILKAFGAPYTITEFLCQSIDDLQRLHQFLFPNALEHNPVSIEVVSQNPHMWNIYKKLRTDFVDSILFGELNFLNYAFFGETEEHAFLSDLSQYILRDVIQTALNPTQDKNPKAMLILERAQHYAKLWEYRNDLRAYFRLLDDFKEGLLPICLDLFTRMWGVRTVERSRDAIVAVSFESCQIGRAYSCINFIVETLRSLLPCFKISVLASAGDEDGSNSQVRMVYTFTWEQGGSGGEWMNSQYTIHFIPGRNY